MMRYEKSRPASVPQNDAQTNGVADGTTLPAAPLLDRGATMLLVGGAAYKLGQNSVKQIEEYAGRPAEELSEQELETAMDHLGIEEEEITDADMAAIEAEAVDAPAPSSPSSATAAESDYISEIERLAGLADKGIITEEEFQAKKKSLLGL